MNTEGAARRRIFFLGACLAPFLAACSATRSQVAGDPVQEVRRIENVPFYEDDSDQCGPSTLASVLTFAGRPTTPAELKPEIYSTEARGTLPMDLLPAVEDRGLSGRVFNGTLLELRQEIREGRPVLAYLNLGLSFYPQGHYVVVTGFDDARGGLFAHDARIRDKFIPYRKFMKGWNKTGRWALTVTPRDAWIPATPS
jgi:predicted double-glycine peptidase